MAGKTNKRIWTIGHSTRDLDTFIKLLHSAGIAVLADIRNFPGSRRYPHFNKEALEHSLPSHGIEYIHFKDLGGRRKPAKDSVNTTWRNEAFRGYADYMSTPEFTVAFETLEQIAAEKATAYMCSEAVWWSCHRSLVSDLLKVKSWTVLHIMAEDKLQEHPYTSAARIVDGRLTYRDAELF